MLPMLSIAEMQLNIIVYCDGYVMGTYPIHTQFYVEF